MTSPLQAIRKKCVECSGGSWKEARACPCTDCSLWAFRLGKKPQEADAGPYKEYRPRKKKDAIWAARTWDWKNVIYIFEQNENYIVGDETFEKLEAAKIKMREDINALL